MLYHCFTSRCILMLYNKANFENIFMKCNSEILVRGKFQYLPVLMTEKVCCAHVENLTKFNANSQGFFYSWCSSCDSSGRMLCMQWLQ